MKKKLKVWKILPNQQQFGNANSLSKLTIESIKKHSINYNNWNPFIYYYHSLYSCFYANRYSIKTKNQISMQPFL